MRTIRLGGRWLVPLLSIASLSAASSDMRLVEAVKKADKAAVRALLQQRIDVNTPEADGTTALHWAAQQDDRQTADLLIRAGANVKAANRYGVTPLYAACVNGNAAIIEALLKAGADPNTILPEGETALMTAARTGKVDAVKVLLAHGADVNAKERWRGQTSLMWAAAEGHVAVAQALIELGADINARSNGGFTPVLFAARAGQIDAAKAVIAAGANVNDTIQGARPAAGGSGGGRGGTYNPSSANAANNPAAARAALAQALNTGNRGNPGPNGTSALVLAVINAHFELAAALLDLGADPNADGQGWTALHQLAWTRRPPIQHGLPNAVPTGKIDSLTLAKALLAHGANPNARQKTEPADGARNVLDRIGSTPFLLAAKVGDTDYMRVLVAGGADPSLTTEEGTTPMMAAAGVGIWHVGESAGTSEEAFEAVKLAYELGNDVNAVNGNGDTALHGAAIRGANAIVQFLVDKGVKMDARNKIGWTPLTIAEGVMYPNTFNRQLETAALLHQLGAKDPGQRRPEDLPPADVFDAAQRKTQTKP